VKQLSIALQNQGLKVTSVGVADLYGPEQIWASQVGKTTPLSLANALRALSGSRDGTAPTTCTTEQLRSQGAQAWNWNQNGISPFNPTPGAVLVVLIEPGARPQPFASCSSSAFSFDPVFWIPLQWRSRLAQTRFLMIATTEVAGAADMRTYCLAVPGFPTAALDVLAPSANPFFDPWSAQMNGVQQGLATRVDLCDALGSGAPAIWDAMAKQWFPELEKLQ